jgi:hypothetical protein
VEKKSSRETEKMRGMEIKVGDLSASRELWKQKALLAQVEENKQLVQHPLCLSLVAV